MKKIKYVKGRRNLSNALEYTGIHKNTESEMQLYVYNAQNATEYSKLNVSEFNQYINFKQTNWLNVHGLNETELIKNIGNYFNIDYFMLSDILNTNRRTKIEEHTDVLFFNIKSILPTENSENFKTEQISFLLKDGILISFQEKRSDFFTHIRERIKNHSGIVVAKNADYLLCLLLDSIMDNFYITLENEEAQMESLIDQTKNSSDPTLLQRIEKHRDNYNFLKRTIIPLRDSLYDIKSIKDDDVFNVIASENFTFFSRLYQKSLELLEQIDSDMWSLETASNYFFAMQTHKMNEIMKTLTVISVIFIPLTFIVGVYGMNFDNMPELREPNGYFFVMTFMFLTVTGMIVYFKKRKWF